MSLLPQRKKSPEEIARLREDLGIPTPTPDEDPAPPPDAPAMPVALAIELHHAQADAPLIRLAEPATPDTPPSNTPPPSAAVRRARKQVHSLKRSERIPIVPLEELQSAEQDAAAEMAPVTLSLKPVRSLRKSEMVPHPVTRKAAPAPDSNLPSHRHSDPEIQEIRRREALAMLAPVVNPHLIAAHPALLIPGYLAALVGAVCFAYYELPITVAAPCAAVSLIISCYISLKKPISLHHAAFIAVITLIVIVFGAIHYFPQLRHGT